MVSKASSVGTSDPKRVIVALDFATENEAWQMLELLDPNRCRVKVGKELFTRAGPAFVSRIIDAGFDVFLDLKYHDIPSTVAGACSAAADLGCWMINVHASGGRDMMSAASECLARYQTRPKLIAVTVLTSLDDTAVAEVGFTTGAEQLVMRLAALGQKCGMDGVVCSTHELESIKQRCGPGFVAVTPGIRPKGSANDDQRRVATPSGAVAAGADFLVIGRPITRAANPAHALDAIYAEISQSDTA